MEEDPSFTDDEAAKEKEQIRATAEIDKYWKDCNGDARWIGIFANGVKAGIEVWQIFWPFSDPTQSNEVENNIVYFIISLICFVFIGLSFKEKYGIRYSYFPIVISIVKIVFIVSDFDDIRETLPKDDWNVIAFNCLGSGFVLFEVMTFLFANFKYNNPIMFCCWVYLWIIGYREAINNDEMPWLWIGLFLSVNICISIGPFVFARHIPKAIATIVKKKRMTEKFKKIFDNLEESIFIVDNQNY